MVKGEKDIDQFFITDQLARSRIAALVGQGTYIALSMNTMKPELAELVHRENDSKDTGMIVEALTETQVSGSGAEWVMQGMDAKQQGRYWRDTFQSSPLHVVVGSLYDGPDVWLQAGRVMERILLAAASLDISHCISAAPVEIPSLTPQLRQEINEEYRPQALFRLGFALNPSFTKLSSRRSSE